MFLIRHILLLLCLTCMASAEPVAITWDPVPEAKSYRVWRGIDIIAASATPLITVDLAPGQNTTLTVTAINSTGESDPSPPLTIYLPPATTLPQRAVTLTLQSSADLRNWATVSTLNLAETADRKFYRLKIETP